MASDGSSFRIGQVVESKAGRDRGTHYVVVGRLNERIYAVADGRSRKAANPKRKSRRHLAPLALVCERVERLIASGQTVEDADLDRGLAEFGL